MLIAFFYLMGAAATAYRFKLWFVRGNWFSPASVTAVRFAIALWPIYWVYAWWPR